MPNASPASTGAVPCPMPSADDVAERVAICGEAAGSDVAHLRRAILHRCGFANETAFAEAHRGRLSHRLARLDVSRLSRTDARLLIVTRSFVASPWFAIAIRHGWADVELFGRGDGPEFQRQGLVPALALHCPPRFCLSGLDAEGATLANDAGSSLAYARFAPRMLSAPWFASTPSAGQRQAA